MKFYEERLRQAENEWADHKGKFNQSSEELFENCLADIEVAIKSRKSVSGPLRELRGFPFNQEERSRVVDLLKRVLENTPASNTHQVFETWGQWCSSEDIPYLLGRLSGAKEQELSGIVKVLGNIGDEQAVGPIIEKMIRVNDTLFNREAIRAIGRLGSVAEPQVLPLLTHAEKDIRRAACEILAKIGTQNSLDALREYANNTDRFARSWAEIAIRSIERRISNGTSGRTKPTRPTVVHHKSNNTVVQRVEKAKAALEVLKSEASNEHLLTKSLSVLASTPKIDELAEEVSRQIMPYLDINEKPLVIIEAIRASGVWGNDSHTNKLNELFSLAKSHEAKIALFDAFKRIGNERSSELLMTFIDDPKYAYEAVGAIRKISADLEEKLIRSLDDPDVYHRGRVAAALGQAGSNSAWIKLSAKVQAEPDTVAREVMLAALARMKVRGVGRVTRGINPVFELLGAIEPECPQTSIQSLRDLGFTVVPEPTTFGLALMGALGILRRTRR